MRNLLFILPTFEIGGTTVSTRNLLSLLDKETYDITVWCLDGQGLLKGLYDETPQVQTTFFVHALAVPSWKTEKGLLRKAAVAVMRQSRRFPALYRYLIRHSVHKVLGKKRFDSVIACEEEFATMFATYIPTSNRIAWVRCDYKQYFNRHKCIKEPFYDDYQHIVCVAEHTTKNFTVIYPELKDRTVCIYNPQDSNFILSQSAIDDHDIRFSTGKTVIISMGRLDDIKRFTMIPPIARQLKEKGMDFVWYIIGDGDERQAIANAISLNDVGDSVVMLGAKSNPHFYIKHADLYVCLSVSEACPRVINEAKILGTPVVSTDFPTVYEYIEDKMNGRIASIENIPHAIEEMLTDTVLYNRIKENISSFKFDNSGLIKQVEAIL